MAQGVRRYGLAQIVKKTGLSPPKLMRKEDDGVILITDDDPAQRRVTGEMLTAASRPWLEAENGAVTADLLGGSVGDSTELVLLELNIDGRSGMNVLRGIRAQRPEIPVIVLTGNGSVADSVAAMRAGAQDYLIKPVSPAKLELAIRNALKMQDLVQEAARLAKSVVAPSRQEHGDGFDGLIAESAATKTAIKTALNGAQSSIPILIEGESGVGKEVFARAIHASSSRATGPFIAVNCGALPENLVESILFGHEKGAFTGAVARRIGKFEEADKGVLFLDEVGELPLGAQVKLLRAVQEGEVDPVGGARTIKTNIRLISATNRNLIAEVAGGRFREDLFYRIGVFPLVLPPLRARREDIPALAHFFTRRWAEKEGKQITGLTDPAIDFLTNAPWPGNIRQMENAIYRAVVMSEGPALEEADFAHVFEIKKAPLPPQGDDAGPSPFFSESGHIRPFAEIERAALQAALDRYEGSMSEAARRLGIGRSTLYRKTRGEDSDGLGDVA